MALQKRKWSVFYIKLLALLSVIRIPVIAFLTIAQYLASIFILSQGQTWIDVIKNTPLLLIILSSNFMICAGFIINNFYDLEKDSINRPTLTKIQKHISNNFQLNTYMFFNFCGIMISTLISFRAVVFFVWYGFALWLYSHKIKKITLIGNLAAAVLAIAPFFAVTVYFRNFHIIIFIHASFLFFILICREILKDITSWKGDIIFNYPTMPIRFGIKKTKWLLTVFIFLSFFPSLYLIRYDGIGNMNYYFLTVVLVLILAVPFLWKAKTLKSYHILLNLIHGIIIFGILSIALIG